MGPRGVTGPPGNKGEKVNAVWNADDAYKQIMQSLMHINNNPQNYKLSDIFCLCLCIIKCSSH